MRAILWGVAWFVSVGTASAQDDTSEPRKLVEAAIAAHGGDAWLTPSSLILAGHAEFYAPDQAAPRSRADDYRMWRVIDPDRTEAHGADGKVRITARSGDRLLFEVGYDGETTWNERGIVPKAEADAYWASNFGFGIIRSALKEGFRIEHAPPRDIGGRPVDLVRIIDPAGSTTLFGIDRDSSFIRYMGFRTPRGWHERYYDDFVRLADPEWVQAREVTLFYDGVRANTVYWRSVVVGDRIPDTLFAWPGEP
ncbi:MAG: hypothetical protein ACK4GD_00890 [Sphingomonadaceae bacterium]